MNILIDKLPQEYEGLKINTNFRSFILFELLMQDNKLNEKEKVAISLNLFYEDLQPKDYKKALDGIIWFYTNGKNTKEKKQVQTVEKKNKKLIYSFEHDADLIYSAFLSQYSIDLNEIEYLHWWKFKSLFEGLNDENKICQYMSYRAMDISKIKDKEQKKYYKDLQRKVALPDNRSEDEKEQDFADALW